MKKLCLLLFFFSASLQAEIQYAADISYMVADLKYSQEHGVKICELQHGILSTFLGDVFMHGGSGHCCPKIHQVFSEYSPTKWAVTSQIAFQPWIDLLKNAPDWKTEHMFHSILSTPDFMASSKIAPQDPHDINSYSGLLYVKPNTVKNTPDFATNFPGILVIDAATHPYWIDKYKMTKLFENDEQLLALKPEWGLYPKKYTDDLAATIKNDIPAENYVIKPRGGFLGNGVLIVSATDLDSTLKYILTISDELKKNKDSSYSYWYRDTFTTFMIEKYYPSDMVDIEALGGKTFEPTMRVAVVMTYNKQKIDIHYLGGYWILPHKSLDEEGTLNELKKAYCKIPFFADAKPEIIEEVGAQLVPALTVLYQKMLEKK